MQMPVSSQQWRTALLALVAAVNSVVFVVLLANENVKQQFFTIDYTPVITESVISGEPVSPVTRLQAQTSSVSSSSLINVGLADDAKIILDWLPWRAKLDRKPYLRHICDGRCVLTNDRRLLDKADVLLMQDERLRVDNLPPRRHRDQMYMWSKIEAPTFPAGSARQHRVLETWRHQFNWTSTYDRNSDFPTPIGRLIRYNGTTIDHCDPKFMNTDFDALLAKRSKAVSWLVSHCTTQSGSHREEFVVQLARHINVTIGGLCSINRGKLGQTQHDKDVTTRHWFYLSLENSICRDYVTEKFFVNAWSHQLVPVVQHRWVYEALVPQKSFIAMDDFGSAEALANHLVYLMSNRTAYLEYFAWQRQFCIPMRRLPDQQKNSRECQICDRIHSLTGHQQQQQQVVDLYVWMDERTQTACPLQIQLWNTTFQQFKYR